MADLPKKACLIPTWLSLPSQWDASISQIEMLQKLMYNVNEIIQYLDDLQANYEEYTDNAVNSLRAELTEKYDAAIASLRAYVDTQDEKYWQDHLEDIAELDQTIQTMQKSLEDMIGDLQRHVDDEFSDIRGDISAKYTEIINKINADVSELRIYLKNYADGKAQEQQEYTDAEIEKLRTYLEDLIAQIETGGEGGLSVKVYDPTTGTTEDVGKVVNDIYNALRVRAITAKQFDDWFTVWEHDADDFKKLDMSALDYDTNAWWYMYKPLEDRISDPTTGKVYPHGRVVENVTSEFRDLGLSAAGFDGLELDSDGWTKANGTAYGWDFTGPGVYDNERTLTIGRTENGFAKTFKLTDVAIGEDGSILTADIPPTVERHNIAVLRPEFTVEITHEFPAEPITAGGFDDWFMVWGHDAADFAALNMSAWEYDNMAKAFMYPEYEIFEQIGYSYNAYAKTIRANVKINANGAKVTSAEFWLDCVDVGIQQVA